METEPKSQKSQAVVIAARIALVGAIAAASISAIGGVLEIFIKEGFDSQKETPTPSPPFTNNNSPPQPPATSPDVPSGLTVTPSPGNENPPENKKPVVQETFIPKKGEKNLLKEIFITLFGGGDTDSIVEENAAPIDEGNPENNMVSPSNTPSLPPSSTISPNPTIGSSSEPTENCDPPYGLAGTPPSEHQEKPGKSDDCKNKDCQP